MKLISVLNAMPALFYHILISSDPGAAREWGMGAEQFYWRILSIQVFPISFLSMNLYTSIQD